MSDPHSLSPPPPNRFRPGAAALGFLRWLGLGIALAAVAAISGYVSMRKAVRGGEVVVPSLQGLSLPEATAALKQAGLILDKSGERSDPRTPAGKILNQDPPEGSKLKLNRKVHVVTSLGAEVLTVPALLGQPARRAQIALQQAGLRVGSVDYVFGGNAGADRVLAQEPPAGTPHGRGGVVNLLVSKGNRPRVWVMPRVEGIGLAGASRLLSEAGFNLTNVRHESAPGIAPGTVVQQYPPPGSPLREGDSVSVVVGAGEGDHD